MLRATPILFLVLLGCASEDPRLPEKLYLDAVQMNKEGHLLEAKTLLEQVAARYPDSPKGQLARKDAYLLDAFYHQDLNEKFHAVRTSMRRISEALKRYRGKRGEFPTQLADLVPEYLDRVPETPWGHPFLYRPFVGVPLEDVQDRRGGVSQRFNTRFDRFYLVCMGTDLLPGGKDMASDFLMADGEFIQDKSLPVIPGNQPVR
jgi:hypothetical protein